jgi:hypothetical protein
VGLHSLRELVPPYDRLDPARFGLPALFSIYQLAFSNSHLAIRISHPGC